MRTLVALPLRYMYASVNSVFFFSSADFSPLPRIRITNFIQKGTITYCMVQCSDSVCGEEKENHFYGFQMHTFGRKPLAFSSL